MSPIFWFPPKFARRQDSYKVMPRVSSIPSHGLSESVPECLYALGSSSERVSTATDSPASGPHAQ